MQIAAPDRKTVLEYWERAARVLAWLGWGGLAAAAVYTAVRRGLWPAVSVAVPFILLGVILRTIRLPGTFQLLLVGVGILNGLGYAWDFFHVPGPYDEITHAFTVFTVTAIAAYFAYWRMHPVFARHPILFGIAVASLGLSLGALNEIMEWVIGTIDPLHDTITDLIMDLVGAVLAPLVTFPFLERER